MSTLNEIAANHARMAKARAEESTELSENHAQIVRTFEAPSPHAIQQMPLHIVGAKDNYLGQSTGYLL